MTCVQGLCKIAVAIQETYSCQVDVAVTGFFQIVACEYTQTAGIDFQHVCQTIFHAEIGNRRFCLVRFYAHVFFEDGIDRFDFCHQGFVGHDFLDAFVRETLE